MSEQPQQTGPGTDVRADDVDPDSTAPAGNRPATSDPDEFIDDGLGLGDGPDVSAPADAGS